MLVFKPYIMLASVAAIILNAVDMAVWSLITAVSFILTRPFGKETSAYENAVIGGQDRLKVLLGSIQTYFATLAITFAKEQPFSRIDKAIVDNLMPKTGNMNRGLVNSVSENFTSLNKKYKKNASTDGVVALILTFSRIRTW